MLDRTFKNFFNLFLHLKPIQDLEKHQELINTHWIGRVFPQRCLFQNLQVKGPGNGLSVPGKSSCTRCACGWWHTGFSGAAEGALCTNELWIYRQGFPWNNSLTGTIEQLIKNSKQGLHGSPVYREDKIALFFTWLSLYYGWFSLSPANSLTWRMVISLEFLQLIW